jgi:hypothetical protein
MHGLHTIVLSAIVAVASTSAARAALTSVAYTDSFAPTQTNWGTGTGTSPTVNLKLHQFDPTFGSLKSIRLTLHSSASGILKVENTDSKQQTVTTNLSAKVAIRRPNEATDFLATFPLVSEAESIVAYDGKLDFAGASGRAYSSLLAEQSMEVIPAVGSHDWELFVGSGDLILPAYATGLSSVLAGGNIATGIRTLAGADLTVVYTYQPFTVLVPEPTFGVVGLIAVGLVSSRRRAAR